MTSTNWINSLHHDSSPLYVKLEHDELNTKVSILLRADIKAPIEKIFLRTCPDGEQSLSPMQRVNPNSLSSEFYKKSSSVCQWWEAQILITMRRFNYRFFIHSTEGSWWFSALGAHQHTPTDSTDFKLLVDFKSPKWVNDSVFYQIFPDRFADGDKKSNVKSGEYLCYNQPVIARSWGELPKSHNQTGGVEFFGGDLVGVTKHLDHLVDLGINAIYLNPIFTAPSNHKYDTADYLNVDPHFGGNLALTNLRNELSKQEIRLMLDIVLNHCGSTHPWFTDAQANPSIETAEFFTFTKHPNKYASWLGISTLPKLNYRSEELRKRIYASPDAILRYWLRPPFSIDGWRIDVANMMARQGEAQLGHKIGRGIRRAVKAEFPETYLLGEHFHDGTPHLQGEELDASMNYRGFAFPLLNWLAGYDIDKAFIKDLNNHNLLPTKAFALQLQTFLAAIPWQIAKQQFNQLGSHDTPRILTLVDGNIEKAKLAATILLTYPGVPCVYYGDEIGLLGAKDPDNRRCMIWDKKQWNQKLYKHYRNLINIRRSSTALCWGGFQILFAENETFAFLREEEQERIIVVIRRAKDKLNALPVRTGGIADGTTWEDLLTGQEKTVHHGHLPLGRRQAISMQVWREKN
ncbi:MAG: maltodextrin glucosidase [Acidobacteria bacterium]|nr:maltodextrin glucosidase [Acidobacteriota bacterium]